uniref:separase n=1 Tax=Scleropages formosus TaxID=113540 RepID=A0A8C9V3Y1_SCLFO
MAEPITLWVKTKADAARGGEEDMRLRWYSSTGKRVMLSLLEEELRAYREVAGDTAQERYNVLCDLLDICHEGSMHTHRRAVYLYEMAQVVCFQDFSEQTDCSAVDFTVESLRLLNEEQETAENTDQLMDDKAQASLWLYICTLEKNLQDVSAQEQRLSLEPVGTNDLDYEDKQKQQDSQLVYEGLCFNLTAERKCSEPLDKALELWRNLLAKDTVPVIRTPKQTVSSIVLMAALYKLMGKPLRALESHQLAVGFSHKLSDAISCASSMCYSARLLLEMGTPELAQLQLEQAEKLLPPVDSSSEGISPLHVFATLVRAELCYRTNQVEKGVSHLCQVLKEVGEQRHSKSWYLLRARALQTASAYLGLDVTSLPSNLRQRITEYGLKTPDTTLYDSLKLLCSLVVTLVGNGLYGTNVGVDTRFVDQGDNVLLKWQLLAEVLSCSFRMVAVRRLSGAVHEAKVQCLEALKLTTKLQTLSQCAEFLVMKAELELQKGESTPSGMDLEQVKDLLDLCTDFTSKTKKMEVKIKPRKGRPAKKPACPAPVDDDCSDLLKTRSFFQQPVAAVDEWAQSASPKLRSKDMGWLVSLGHKADCCCLCCSDPGLGRVCVRWAAAQAELALHLHQGVGAVQSQKLFLTALSHCRSVTAKLSAELFRLMPAKDKPYPSFLDDLMGRIYLRMSLSSLELPLQKSASVWELLDSGFAFVASRSSPELESIRVSLQATKALAYIITLAAQNKCRPEELFSAMWTWNPMVKAHQKAKVLWSNTKAKDPVTSSKAKEVKKVKDPGVSITCQETKMFTTVPMLFCVDGLTLELVRDLLCSTLLSLQHFPPLWIYPRLCGLLALAQGDLLTTAMLHSQSLGITARHHMTRHLATRLKKLKKDCSSDLVDKLDSLSLDDACAQMPLHQKLTELERIFTFPTTDPSAFPHQHCEDFTQQLKMIPSGVTVCLLSVVGVQPREIGDTVLLTRLERDASPVTVCIPTAQLEVWLSAVIQEMDNVQKQQKVVSSVADKAQWWEGRRSLDTRMEVGLVVLSASPLLSQQDLHALASGLCPERAAELVSLLQVAVSALSNRAEPQGHTVLILDKYLQKLPWESISCLRSHSVTRMPSLHFLIGHCLSKKLDPTSVLNVGVDLKKVFYVLNPDANLKDTEERFKEWFAKEPAWKGVCGTAPNPTELQEAVTTKDLYIYVGHGAGARFLDGQRILKEDLHAASLLFGCSSAALAVYGELEGSGIILNYLMAGCPLILGNLWDVTDRDIDRFTKALLQSWFSAGPGAALLNHMASSRQATHLKYLIGAAPVVYGLPVSLQKEEC